LPTPKKTLVKQGSFVRVPFPSSGVVDAIICGPAPVEYVTEASSPSASTNTRRPQASHIQWRGVHISNGSACNTGCVSSGIIIMYGVFTEYLTRTNLRILPILVVLFRPKTY
jgi:hypothetical protein